MKLMSIVEQSLDFIAAENLEAGDNIKTLLGTLEGKNANLHTDVSELITTNEISVEATSISSFLSALEELSLQE